MDWTRLLTREIESTYHAAEGLVRLVRPEDLPWTPATGANWMTTAQLLEHLTTACGLCCKGFVVDGWGDAPAQGTEMEPPPAAGLPSAASVEETLARLAADKALALAMVRQAGETALATRRVTAPWDRTAVLLGERLLSMVAHLAQHKAQLFYYLKLQGKPVHTGHLWGL